MRVEHTRRWRSAGRLQTRRQSQRAPCRPWCCCHRATCVFTKVSEAQSADRVCHSRLDDIDFVGSLRYVAVDGRHARTKSAQVEELIERAHSPRKRRAKVDADHQPLCHGAGGHAGVVLQNQRSRKGLEFRKLAGPVVDRGKARRGKGRSMENSGAGAECSRN